MSGAFRAGTLMCALSKITCVPSLTVAVASSRKYAFASVAPWARKTPLTVCKSSFADHFPGCLAHMRDPKILNRLRSGLHPVKA